MFTKTKSSIFSKIAIAIVLVTAIIVGFFFIQKSLAQSQAVAPAITNYIRDFNAKVGKADSNVKVIYLFDFSCSACQANAENISKIVADTKDKVQFVFKPFITHPGSGNRNANAAYAANLQGKYFEYEEKLIQINKGKNGNATDKDHEQLAEQLGMDLVKFNKDKNSKETEGWVKVDQGDISSTAVPASEYTQGSDRPSGTPSYVIVKDDKPVSWWTGGVTPTEFAVRLNKVTGTN